MQNALFELQQLLLHGATNLPITFNIRTAQRIIRWQSDRQLHLRLVDHINRLNFPHNWHDFHLKPTLPHPGPGWLLLNVYLEIFEQVLVFEHVAQRDVADMRRHVGDGDFFHYL